MFLLKAAVFLVGTTALAWVSRASLRVQCSHGLFRFFAWEAILALILLNIDAWFRDPFSWHQIVSWVLLMLSLVLVLHGVHLLRVVGKPDNQRDDVSLVGLEKTTALVKVGAYRYIRHPLYSSLLFLAWGTFFKVPSWLGGVLALVGTLFLVATARVEERENVRFFGPAYEVYMKQTKMFVPFLF